MTPTNFTCFEADDVLEGFMIENPNPSAKALEIWMKQFPDQAGELLKFAPILRLQANRPTKRDDRFMAIIMTLYQTAGYDPAGDQWAQCALEHDEFLVDILQYAEAARITGPYKPGESVKLPPEQEREADRKAEAILDELHRLERLKTRVDSRVLDAK